MGDIFGIVIVRPFGLALTALYNVIGSYGIAVILFALIVKLILMPFAYKGKRNMLKMTRVQSRMADLQKKYANNRVKLNEEIQKLYEAEGVSPMSGCLPSFLPLPIMLGLYYAVVKPMTFMMGLSSSDINLLAAKVGIEVTAQNSYTVQPQIAEACNKFFDAAGNLDPSIASLSDGIAANLFPINFNFFGINLSEKPQFALNVLILIPILSGLTAFLSSYIMQKMQGSNNAGAANSTMKTMLYIMPLMSIWFGFQFPAAIGIYWIFNNIITCIQEIILTKIVRKRHPVEPEETGKKKKKKEEA